MANMNPNRPGPQTGNKQDTHTHTYKEIAVELEGEKKKENLIFVLRVLAATLGATSAQSLQLLLRRAKPVGVPDRTARAGKPQDGRTARRKRWHCLLTSFGLARLGQIVLVSVDCLRRVSIPDIRGRGGGPTLKSGSEFLEQGHMD